MTSSLDYKVIEGWEQLPQEFTHRNVPAVAVDSRDRVHLLTRGDARVLVYDRAGTFLTTFGKDLFTDRTHGLTIGPDDSVYVVDDGDHTVRKFTPDGELLMTLGTKGVPSDTGYDASAGSGYDKLVSIAHSGLPFNRPTDVAVAPSGELYVSDGYGNARVHRFSADGELIQSWGKPGGGPGEFRLPHGIWVAADGRVLVADRENDRIQIFSPQGAYLDQWTHVQCPTGIYIDHEGLVYVSELRRLRGEYSFSHGVVEEEEPGRVSVLDAEGNILVRWGGADGSAPGNFLAPHGICVDSRGDLYVGEVTHSWSKPRSLPVPPDCHTFQKFARQRPALG